MSEIVTVRLDLAKNVFQAHGADVSGWAVLRRKLRRHQVLEFFAHVALPLNRLCLNLCGGTVAFSPATILDRLDRTWRV